MIRVGIVGLGFMGWIHWLSYQKLRGVKVAAVCDPKPRRLAGDWRGLRGNFGPPGEQVDLQGAAPYLNWLDLIRDPAIDLVDITLPTALHAEVAIAALAAGKHVLCEKPMALEVKDCRRMMTAAKRFKRILLIAHVLPFFPEYTWALKIVRSGKYGRPRNGWFKRHISEPTWMQNYWSANGAGGPMFDLHVHDAHFIRLLFGQPKSVKSDGQLRGELPELWSANYYFANPEVSARVSCGVFLESRPLFNHGFQISLSRARGPGVGLEFEFGVFDGKPHYVRRPTLTDQRGRKRIAKLRSSDPIDSFVAELRAALRCVRTGQALDILDPVLAMDAIRICQAETISLIRGTTIRV